MSTPPVPRLKRKGTTATVYTPDGEALKSFERRKPGRAILSAKGWGIQTLIVHDFELETGCAYEPGTYIECEGNYTHWDGEAWLPGPPPPKEQDVKKVKAKARKPGPRSGSTK